MKTDYDIVVIGGGSAGLTAAQLAKGLGKKVVLVEKDKIGGECTWSGCVPSKTLIHVANIAQKIHTMNEVGLKAEVTALDTSNVMDYVRSIIQEVYAHEKPEIFEKKGITVLSAVPSFIDNHSIVLNGKTVSARSFIIATGSLPFVPPIEGIEKVSYLTNKNLFDLKTLPKSMIILGGGAIGVEMALALQRLGVQITILEMQDRLLAKEDRELVDLLTETFKKQGIQIFTKSKAVKVEQSGNNVMVTYQDTENNKHKIIAEKILVAVGRKPNVDGLQLEQAGVQVGKKNIIVNDYLRTTAKNIYACGDVVGPYQFSHMAFYQAAIATRNAVIPFFKKKVSYKNVCWVTFCDPELASAGLNEQQAREQYGDTISVYRYPYNKLDRAYTENSTLGLAKFICDKKGYMLGAQIFGAQAGQLISEFQVGKTMNLKFNDFYSVIHPYPTYSEIIWHTAKQHYIDTLKQNVFLRFLQKLMNCRKN